MWISRKRWKVLEKRIADLEKQAQSQQKCIIHPSIIADCLSQRVQERMSAIRRMHMKETYTDEQKSPSTNEVQLAMDCTTQHIREFLAQSTNGEIADLGKVCGSNCKIWEAGRCKDFDWLKNLDPIISQSSVKISVCNAGDTNRG